MAFIPMRKDRLKYSEQIITPAYYDKTLNGTYVRDEESKDMLDIIFNNRIFDVGHLYKVSNLQETITNLLRNNNPTGLSKLYASYQRASTAYIANINKSWVQVLASRQYMR